MINLSLLRNLRKPLLLFATIVAFAIAASGVTYNYMAFAPCGSCHQQQPFLSSMAASPHADVTCIACHGSGQITGRLDFGIRHLANAIRSPSGSVRELSGVRNDACLSCHETVLDAPLTKNGIRINHSYCSLDSQCTECHSTVAHGGQVSWIRTYTMEACLECHVSNEAMDCGMCHAGRSQVDRITSGTFATTHGDQWERTHGMGNSATCVACHTAATCNTCHGPGTPHSPNFVRVHSDYAVDPEQQCVDCHRESFCDDCHGTEMPHTNQFVRNHARPANADEELCLRCHLQTDCSGCHVTHVHPGGAIGTLQDEPGGN